MKFTAAFLITNAFLLGSVASEENVVTPKVGTKTALLIIDVQNCFMEESGTTDGKPGSLPVDHTAELIPMVNELRESCVFDTIIRSQDFHAPHHISFGSTHGLAPFAHLEGKGELPLTCVSSGSGLTNEASCCPTYHISPYDCETTLCPNITQMELNDANDGRRRLSTVLDADACTVCKENPDECFQTTQAMWTDHCLQDGDSTFPNRLITKDTDVVVQKGVNQYVDSYSAFMDNTQKLKTPLEQTLIDLDIGTIYLLGIATDYCVYFSTVDAIKLGFDVKLILDATRGISAETVDAAVKDMVAQGAQIVNSTDLLADTCEDSDTTTNEESGSVGLRTVGSVVIASIVAVLAMA